MILLFTSSIILEKFSVKLFDQLVNCVEIFSDIYGLIYFSFQFS